MLGLSQFVIRNKIANDPYYRFQSLKEVAIAAALGISIDVNLATVDDWLRLPGISIHQARSLVKLAEMGVQFVCLEDIAAAIDVPITKIQAYQSILTFAYYDRLSPLSPVKININCASLADILIIPGIDRELAQKLINNRQERGKFGSMVDLAARLNLDSNTTSQLMYYLRF